MITTTIEEMHRNTQSIIDRVVAGETIVIVEHDQAVAEIKPLHVAAGAERPFGLARGQFVVPGDFNAPLPEEILRSFEGASD